MQSNIEISVLRKIDHELREGMALAKCRQCGCMKETLEALADSVGRAAVASQNEFAAKLSRWHSELEPIKYACLGCDYCFPAVAMNLFNAAYPDVAIENRLSCAFEVKQSTADGWPVVPGEYRVLCRDGQCPVAISTLGTPELTDTLAQVKPAGVCIVGKTETENIGIDKVIKNTITNPAIRFLMLVGQDPKGHLPGQTLLSLAANGVDEKMRVIGSEGKRPILRNLTRADIESFRKQVQVINLIGCDDVQTITRKSHELSTVVPRTSGGCPHCSDDAVPQDPTEIPEAPIIQAKEPDKIQMDRAGYFVILPQPDKGTITVEHYSYDNELLHVVQGNDARSLYWTLIENGWVTQLSHSAYLGKELAKAEVSLKYGFKYIQDGA